MFLHAISGRCPQNSPTLCSFQLFYCYGEKVFSHLVLCIIEYTMDDNYLISINRLQEVIDSLYPILLNNNLEEKRENLDTINDSVTQLESKKIPVPDDLYRMQKDLKIDISRMESAKETLLYLSSTFAQFQEQLEPLLKVTASSPRRKKTVRKAIRTDIKHPSGSIRKGRCPYEIILGFTFVGKDYTADTWIDFYMKICEILYNEHSDVFDQVLILRGAKRPYFAKDQNLLRIPKEIPRSDVFLESNLSSTKLRKNAIELIKMFGYKEEDIQFKSAPGPS